MSNLPGVDLTVEDGGLGVGLPSTGKSVAVCGISSAGDENTPRGYVNKGKLIAANGYGPGPEASCLYIAKGALVVFCKENEANAATFSSVEPGGDNEGSSVLTLTDSTPFDTYDGYAECTRANTVGDTPGPTIKYSLDGQQTFTEGVGVPVDGVIEIENTGLKLTFSAAAMAEGDTYTFTTVAPTTDAQGVEDAVQALSDSSKEWRFVHIVGTADASLASSVATQMDEMEENARYVSALLEVRDLDGDEEADWADEIIADFGDFVSNRIAVGAGHCLLKSAVSSRVYRRPFAWAAAQRAVAVEVHVDLGRVKDGPITAVQGLFYDERVSELLDSERFITGRTFIGEPGFFVTNPNLMSSPGSDFKYWQNRFVMDLACRTTHATLQKEVNDDVRVNDGLDDPTKAGFMVEEDRLAIEAANNEALRNDLIAPGHASAARTTVAADDDILATSEVNVEIEIIPVGYKKKLNATMKFVKSLAA